VEASTGSACTSGSAEPSHVLQAMGVAPERIRGSLRLTLGRTTTADETARAAELVAACVARVRAAADVTATEVPVASARG
jgi:cysteine desulfurase